MTLVDNSAFTVLRVCVGLLFLNAAWACGKDTDARTWTKNETSLLFHEYGSVFAFGGIAIMGLGGLSILFGILPRVGGLALSVFLALGAKIHFIQQRRATSLQHAILESIRVDDKTSFDEQHLAELGVSAALGHKSSALKNLALIGATLLFGLAGGGDWIVIGVNQYFQWVGLFAR